MTLDVTTRMIEPAEFYRAQLTANKVVASPEDIVKFAEARKIPVHVAKLAKLYFEQLALDGVRYADEDARAEDSIKMAQAYFEQAEETAKTATTVADKALEKLATVAEELLKAEGITGVTVAELLKVASLQQESKLEFEAAEVLKVETRKVAAARLKISDAKLANLMIGALPRENFYVGGVTTPENLRPDAAGQMAKAMGYEGPNPEQLLVQHMNSSPEMLREHLHGVLQHGYANPGSTFEASTKAFTANAPGAGGWMSRNSKWLIPTGVLGAGAAYLLYRHMKNKDDERKQQLMAAMVSRRQPAMG